MNRVLTTALAVVLLLGLGALAVLAMPSGSAALNAAPFVSAAPPAQEGSTDAVAAPDAPDVTSQWNAIAMPLIVPSVNTSAKVANYINSGDPAVEGSGITRVLKWNGLRWLEYYPQAPFLGDEDFTVNTGDALMVLADASLAANRVSWVGEVPALGAVQNDLTPNAWNYITIPLDQYDTYGSLGAPTGTAATLAADITNVNRVMFWDSTVPRWFEYYPDAPFLGDEDFPVYMGYPYMIHTKEMPPTKWP